MTSESDMRAAGAFAAEDFTAEGFPEDRFDRASCGAASFDVDVFAAAGFATFDDFAVVRKADFFTGLCMDFFMGM